MYLAILLKLDSRLRGNDGPEYRSWLIADINSTFTIFRYRCKAETSK